MISKYAKYISTTISRNLESAQVIDAYLIVYVMKALQRMQAFSIFFEKT